MAARQAALALTPVAEVWGIGRRYARKLQDAGIYTAAELAGCSEAWVRRQLGGVVGVRLWHELHGRPSLPFVPMSLSDEPESYGSEHDESDEPSCATSRSQPRHSVTCTRSFGRPQSSPLVLADAVATFVGRCAEKLRRDDLAAHLLTVVLGTDRFAPGAADDRSTFTATLSLPVATNFTGELTRIALLALRQLQRPGTAYSRAGVLLSGLERAGQGQLSIFTSVPDQQRQQELMRVLDQLNAQFGRHMVRSAAIAPPEGQDGQGPAWQGRSAFRSPAYTTRWDELWKVKC